MSVFKQCTTASAALVFVMACGAQSAMAAEVPTSVAANASLTNFGYKVTDLAPDDGVAASIRFGNGGAIWTGHDGEVLPGIVTASNTNAAFPGLGTWESFQWGPAQSFPALAISKDGAWRSSSANGNLNVSTAFQLTSQGIVRADGTIETITLPFIMPIATGSIGDGGGWSSAQLYYRPVGTYDGPVERVGDPFVRPNAHDFVLAPHTSVTFSGTLAARVDVSQGEHDPFAQDVDLFGQIIPGGLYASSTIEVGHADAIGVLADEYESYAAMLTAVKAAYGAQEATAEAGTLDTYVRADGRDFSLTFANTGDTELKGTLRLSANVSMLMAAPVPEPGTWLLMGLGLAGLALARRRA